MHGHTKPVNTVAFSPCGNFGYSGGEDNRLVMWGLRTGDVISERTKVHTRWVCRIAVAACGAFIVTSDYNDNRVMFVACENPRADADLGGTRRGR